MNHLHHNHISYSFHLFSLLTLLLGHRFQFNLCHVAGLSLSERITDIQKFSYQLKYVLYLFSSVKSISCLFANVFTHEDHNFILLNSNFLDWASYNNFHPENLRLQRLVFVLVLYPIVRSLHSIRWVDELKSSYMIEKSFEEITWQVNTFFSAQLSKILQPLHERNSMHSMQSNMLWYIVKLVFIFRF